MTWMLSLTLKSVYETAIPEFTDALLVPVQPAFKLCH